MSVSVRVSWKRRSYSHLEINEIKYACIGLVREGNSISRRFDGEYASRRILASLPGTFSSRRSKEKTARIDDLLKDQIKHRAALMHARGMRSVEILC
jgi:hypothetical protein